MTRCQQCLKSLFKRAPAFAEQWEATAAVKESLNCTVIFEDSAGENNDTPIVVM